MPDGRRLSPIGKESLITTRMSEPIRHIDEISRDIRKHSLFWIFILMKQKENEGKCDQTKKKRFEF